MAELTEKQLRAARKAIEFGVRYGSINSSIQKSDDMTQIEWEQLLTENLQPMTYYVIVCNGKYVANAFWHLTGYTTIAKTFISAEAARRWAANKAPEGAIWDTEAKTA